MKVSVFGTWARPQNWPKFFAHLSSNTIDYEVVIAGPNKPTFTLPPNVNFIHVDPDPGLCWCAQIAAESCVGETMIIAGDDMIFSSFALDNMYRRYTQENDYKFMVHPRWGTGPDNDLTETNSYLLDIPNSKLRYGFPLFSRQLFVELGGYDRRFNAGPYDADFQLRAYAQGSRFVYTHDAFVAEDIMLTPGGLYGGAWYKYNGYDEVQKLLWGRWYSNEQHYDSMLLSEPRTPFEPIRR